MNKLTREQKEKVITAIDAMWKEVYDSAECETETFGEGPMAWPSAQVSSLNEDSIDGLLKTISEITDTDFIDLDTSWSLEEIKAIPEGDDYDILHEIPGLKEVESYGEDRNQDKYKYTVSVFLHEKSGKHLMWTFQDCARSGAFLSFEYNGEVEKKEVTTTRWV